MPKFVVSTVSFSPLIPPDRLSPDIQMILWAGGLYGLNPVCKASLSQAAGAVLGQRILAAEGAGDTKEPLHLKSWELVELPGERKFKEFIKITASDGSVGYSRALGGTRDLKLAEQGVARVNLLDHESLYDLMVAKQVPNIFQGHLNRRRLPLRGQRSSGPGRLAPRFATMSSCAGARCRYRNACIMSSAGVAVRTTSSPASDGSPFRRSRKGPVISPRFSMRSWRPR